MGVDACLKHCHTVKEMGTLKLYEAQLEQDDDGRWSAWIESLPGCAAWGYSQDEALSALRDAAEAYIEDMVEAGDQTPHSLDLVIGQPTVNT